MFEVFRGLSKLQGACCPAEYIRQTRLEPSQSLADFLGVSVRTIRYWRLRTAKGKVKCEKRPNCPRRLAAIPLQIPRQRRSLQRLIPDSEHFVEQSHAQVSSPPSDARDKHRCTEKEEDAS